MILKLGPNEPTREGKSTYRLLGRHPPAHPASGAENEGDEQAH